MVIAVMRRRLSGCVRRARYEQMSGKCGEAGATRQRSGYQVKPEPMR